MDRQALSDLPKKSLKGLTSDLAFLSGGGEMGERMRSFDFSTTPLGPVSAWPQSLRSAVSICLNSRFPIVLYWGKQFVSLYNDAYIPVWGEKHPWALGRPFEVAWADIWDVLGPVLKRVMETGTPSWSEDQLLIMQRHGYAEETFFTFSFGAGRDEQGEVGGIFCAVAETTQRVLHERRLDVLRELTADAKSPQEAVALAAQILDRQADIPFALVYLLDQEGQTARLAAHTGIPPNSPAAPPVVDVVADDSDTWPLAEAIATGAPTIVTDLGRRFGPLPGRPWPEPAHTAIVLPLQRAGQPESAGLLILGVSPRRRYDESYLRFFELVAGHVATMLANACAYEEERKRAEALAELDRAKTAFFSNVSHEFRTPLTLMLGPLEELKAQFDRSESLLDARQYQQLDLVHRNGLRLLKLVNTLLDFSRIEAGRVQAVYEETDLATFTTELASVFRSAIERAGLDLIVDCPPLSEPVYVDRDMWEKIVLNLLSNAFKFTFKGEIEVALRPSGKHVELFIRDTGTGILDDQLSKIFERFHRVAGSQGRTHEGTGIGLSLVQELARLHGGSVSVDSVYGKGSTFRVFVPLGKSHLPHKHIGIPRRQASTATGVMPFVEEALRWLPSEGRTELSESDGSALDPQSSALPGSPQPSVFSTEATRPRVLLADDNADMRDYVRRLLSSQGYEVESVADGQAALDRVHANPPDIVLTDVMMPKLDGFGLLRALHDDPATKTIPVILLSARASEESRIEGLEHGADDYLIKPFSARELLARVQAHLDMARIRREAGEALRESEERFRTLSEAVPAMVWICRPDGYLLHLNHRWIEYTGQTEKEYQGYGWADTMHPEDRPRILAQWKHCTDTGELYEGEVRYRRRDGQYRWHYFRGVPLREGGHIIAWYGTSLDIQEKKAAENALRESEERFKTMADTAPAMLWVTEPDGTSSFLSRGWYEFTGQTEAEAFGHGGFGWLQAVHPDDHSVAGDIFLAANAKREPFALDYRLRRADGEYRWAIDTGRPRFGPEGEFLGYIGSVIDMHERKRAEERLAQFTAELEQRVAERTYELAQSEDRLRTMAIELNLTEQRERMRLATELHDHLQQTLVLGKLTIGQGKRVATAVPAVEQILKNVDDIFSETLTYTRTLVSDLSPTVLRDHGLPAALQWLGTYMRKYNQTVTVTVPDYGDLKLPEDQVLLLFQSVRELLINSAKHSGTGEASVRMDQRDGLLRIDVRDEGAGFDLAAAAGTPSGDISSKFGLFSIRERMRALGGSFDLQSTSGQGTTVTLTLPLAAKTPVGSGQLGVDSGQRVVGSGPRSLTTAHSPLSTHENPRIRVLLVDDHIMVRQGLRSVLDAYGDVELVGEAGNGEEAVQLVEQLRPAVVVMDINMPKMNGIKATQEIKTRYPNITVIGLSVNAAGENQEAMKRAGAVQLMTKEAAVEELYEVIMRHVGPARESDSSHSSLLH